MAFIFTSLRYIKQRLFTFYPHFLPSSAFFTKYVDKYKLLGVTFDYFTIVPNFVYSLSSNLVLKPAYCKTTTFQVSFFNRNVKPWNFVCNLAPYDNFSSLSSFKKFLRATYFTLLDTTYNIDMPCTWFLSHNCHRS